MEYWVLFFFFFFFNDTATTEIYTLSLHDALPICGTRPGQLVPPGDPAALAATLGDWLDDERHRHRLRAAARQRRSTLRGWEQTTQEIANALTAHRCRKPVPPGVNNHAEKTSGPV